MSDVTFETVAWKAIAHRDQLGDAVRFVAGPCHKGWPTRDERWVHTEVCVCKGSGLVPYDLSVLPEEEVREAAEMGLLLDFIASACGIEAFISVYAEAVVAHIDVKPTVDAALDALGEASPAPGG